MRRASLIVAALLAPVIAACVPIKEPAPPPAGGGVIVYGDSLIEEAKPYLHGVTVRAFGGTALCDWVANAASAAATERPRAIVLSFIGNNLTPCMAGAQTPEQVRAKYTVDMAELKSRVGVPLLWVVNPVCRDQQACPTSFAGEPAPNALYTEEPWRVDAGARVEGPNGEFLSEYRDADGAHLNDEGARRYAGGISSALG